MATNVYPKEVVENRQAAEGLEQTVKFGAKTSLAAKAKPDDSLTPVLPASNPRDPLTTVLPASVDADALADMQTYSNLQEKRKKAKRKRVITIVIVCVVAFVVLVGGALWFVGSMAADPAGDMAPQSAFVEEGLFLDEVSASGKLKPVSSVIATPEVEGLVGEVWVSEGTTVEAGQVLYTVVNDELDRAIAQAGQGVNEANNGVAQAQIAVEDAYRAKQQGLAAAAAGTTDPSGAGSSTPFDVGQADSAIKQAELSLSNAWSAYNSALATYDEAVARAAKRTVTAPISGSVVAVNIEPGQAISGSGGSSASAPVQIADLTSMLVSVEVNEVDILKIKADQAAKLTFSALPDLEVTGTVNRIATVNSGSGGEGGMGSGTVTYTVDILVQSPDPRLKPGMTAKATVESQRIEDTLMVPLSAVTTLTPTEGYVLVVDPEDPENVQERAVEILASNGLTMAVKGNLTAGEELLISGGAGAMGAMDMDTATSSADATGSMVVSVG